MTISANWLLLVLTLSTENASARMRFWRALKAMGAAVLRDGAYLLPASKAHEQSFAELAEAIAEAAGTAHVLNTISRDPTQDAFFRGLFDCGENYVEFCRSLSEARKTLSRAAPSEIKRLERRLRREYEAIRACDHFPGDASVRAEASWSDFVAVIQTVLSPDEPHSEKGSIARLNKKTYQGRIWATRRNLWVDRVASAWLIRRFIDRKASFLWLDKPSACPKKALGFDFNGAAFTHVGKRVTFEVLLASFALDADRGLVRLGEMVHSLDIGGASVPEASGFEALMIAARQRDDDDDRLLDEMGRILDSFYAFYSRASGRGKVQ